MAHLTGSSKEGYCSKRAGLPMMLIRNKQITCHTPKKGLEKKNK
jgi:hypothetical protein